VEEGVEEYKSSESPPLYAELAKSRTAWMERGLGGEVAVINNFLILE